MNANPEFPPSDFDEDAEQAHIVSHPDVHLYYDASTRLVVRGEHAGVDVDLLAALLVVDTEASGLTCAAQEVTLRPWWRWFRLTPAIRLSCTFPLGRLLDSGFSPMGEN